MTTKNENDLQPVKKLKGAKKEKGLDTLIEEIKVEIKAEIEKEIAESSAKKIREVLLEITSPFNKEIEILKAKVEKNSFNVLKIDDLSERILNFEHMVENGFEVTEIEEIVEPEIVAKKDQNLSWSDLRNLKRKKQTTHIKTIIEIRKQGQGNSINRSGAMPKLVKNELDTKAKPPVAKKKVNLLAHELGGPVNKTVKKPIIQKSKDDAISPQSSNNPNKLNNI